MNDQLKLAKQLASEFHVGQFRRDGNTPYISHPASVAKRVTWYGEMYQAIAWLHDVIEDSDGKVHVDLLLLRGVEPIIVDAVVSLTKVEGEDYGKYLARVGSNSYARVVKIYDMLDNLADNPSEKQILKYAKGLQYLISLS